MFIQITSRDPEELAYLKKHLPRQVKVREASINSLTIEGPEDSLTGLARELADNFTAREVQDIDEGFASC